MKKKKKSNLRASTERSKYPEETNCDAKILELPRGRKE